MLMLPVVLTGGVVIESMIDPTFETTTFLGIEHLVMKFVSGRCRS
jgi:hypothetical protein